MKVADISIDERSFELDSNYRVSPVHMSANLCFTDIEGRFIQARQTVRRAAVEPLTEVQKGRCAPFAAIRFES